MLVCFTRPTAPVVTITSSLPSSNKIQNGDILVPAKPDLYLKKWPLNSRARSVLGCYLEVDTICKYGFSNKIHTVEEIAKKADETQFLKMQCKQHSLNPTLPPLKPNTHGLRPRGHSYELPECLLQFLKNSCFIRCLYIYTYDDDAVLHCFMSAFLCDCTDCIIMHV